MKGKFIKKLTAYALTAAMVVATPMTAFASEFADNFWVSDGESTGTGTGTGTVSTTDTNTTVLNENAANIKGIKIDPASVVMNVGEQKKLTAKILYVDDSVTSADDQKAIITHLKWRTSNNSIVTVDAKKGTMDVCPINAKKNGFATVTAGLDLDNDGVDDFIASVKVMVKRTITSIDWDVPTDAMFYAGHTYDLHEYVLVNGTASDASDDIAFAISADPKKEASINGDGILTVSKSFKESAKEVTVVATTPGLEPVSTTIKLDKGTPITKLQATDAKPEVQFSDGQKLVDPIKDITVGMTPSTNTDDIAWTSANEKIVKVSEKIEGGKVVKGSATLTGVAVGKTKVTATSTSGKKATFTVTVTAKLISIDEVSINETNTTWTGKTTPVIVKRTPVQNTDKLKITVNGDNKKFVKAKNLNIIPVVDLKGAESITVDITVAPTNKNDAAKAKNLTGITVKQSNVELKGVARSLEGQNKGIPINYKTPERLNPSNKVVTYYPILGTCENPSDLTEAAKTVSWESSKETVATIDNGKLRVVGEGTAKITVAAVSKVNGKFKATKYTFNVKSTPKCEEIVLKSDTATVMTGKTATISVKQQLPKKAADPITWYVNGEKQTNTKNFTDKKAVVSASQAENGVIELLATTGSVSVEAKVYVVSAKAKKVEGTLGEQTLSVGGMTTISAAKADNDEPIVRYEVDKNGASVVKVIPMTGMDGSKSGAMIIAIGKGKATVSAVSASGKTAKFKITVN